MESKPNTFYFTHIFIAKLHHVFPKISKNTGILLILFITFFSAECVREAAAHTHY